MVPVTKTVFKDANKDTRFEQETNKLEQEIGDIKDKLSALEAKNKNEFVKKLDLASDFEV